jgi:hypothetical protein
MSEPEAVVRLSCRRCGHSDDAPEEFLHGIATCDRCGARIAFGRTMPRVIIEPSDDPRFVCVLFDGVAVLLDRAFANLVGRELISVCPALPVEDEAVKRQRLVELTSAMAAKFAEDVAAVTEPE